MLLDGNPSIYQPWQDALIDQASPGSAQHEAGGLCHLLFFATLTTLFCVATRSILLAKLWWPPLTLRHPPTSCSSSGYWWAAPRPPTSAAPCSAGCCGGTTSSATRASPRSSARAGALCCRHRTTMCCCSPSRQALRRLFLRVFYYQFLIECLAPDDDVLLLPEGKHSGLFVKRFPLGSKCEMLEV